MNGSVESLDVLVRLVLVLGAFWAGFWLVFKGVGWDRWYENWSKAIFINPVKKLWNKHKKFFLGMIIGAILVLIFISRPPV